MKTFRQLSEEVTPSSKPEPGRQAVGGRFTSSAPKKPTKPAPHVTAEETISEIIMPQVKDDLGVLDKMSFVKKHGISKTAAKQRLATEAKEKTEYDYEGDMARGQLQSIINNAQRVHDMLEDNDNLPEWVQSKITLAEDYISTVANYMMSEVDEEVMQEGIKDEPHEIVHKDTGKTVSTHKNYKDAYSAYQDLSKASDHAIGHITKKTNEAVSHEPWKDKHFGPTKVIQQKYKVKTDTKTYNVKAETESHAHKLVSNHAPGSKIVSIEHKGRIMEEVKPITELSADTLDRYKEKAKKSSDSLTGQGKYRQANDRTMNVMKATGKQINKTVANIRKALNRESVVNEVMDEPNYSLSIQARQKKADVSKKDVNYPASPAQLTLKPSNKSQIKESRQLQIVREAMADAKKKDQLKKKEKKLEASGGDKFQAEPELSSQINKTSN